MQQYFTAMLEKCFVFRKQRLNSSDALTFLLSLPLTSRLRGGSLCSQQSADWRLSPHPSETRRQGHCPGHYPPRWRLLWVPFEVAEQEVPQLLWSLWSLHRNHPLPPEGVKTHHQTGVKTFSSPAFSLQSPPGAHLMLSAQCEEGL